MAWLPTEWRSVFGGPAIVGQCDIPIASRTSSGPSVSVFDSTNVGTRTPVPSTLVLGYPLTNPLPSPFFNLATEIRGLVVPPGTRSALFIGRLGLGPLCYGTPQECGDPTTEDNGYHAYPYVYEVWAYDLNDLLTVKNGQRRSWEIRPYTTWTIDLPFGTPAHSIKAVAFDSVSSRVFITASSDAEHSNRPLIHVFALARSSHRVFVLSKPCVPHTAARAPSCRHSGRRCRQTP